MFKRYAIYFTAEPGPLADFGAAWLGWDLEAGTAVPHPNLPDLPMPISQITATPRKYGFHATMKPPFRLAEGYDFETLRDQTAQICAGLDSVTLEALSLQRIGRFLALTPVGDDSKLNALAASVVEAFDPFRAPAPEAEIFRRRAAGLTPSQEDNLMRWGYPNVMQDFHFHMTLSGKLAKSELPTIETQLSEAILPHLPSPFEIRSLTLAGEAEDGQFHAIERFALGSS